MHREEPDIGAVVACWVQNAIYLLCILRAGDIWSLLLRGLTCHSNGLLLVTEIFFFF